MRNIQTILAATDFSECAGKALTSAGEVADLLKARLVVAHVLQNLDHTYSLLVDDVLEEQRAEAEDTLGKALDELRISRSRTDSIVTRGSPVDALIRIALQEHVDLVVAGMMGSTCGSGTSFLGSVVDQLVRCGLFELLLVGPDDTPGYQHIAVATDFSESAAMALERGSELAVRSGLGSLTVIHAFDLPSGYSKLGIGEQEAERRAREHIDELFEQLMSDVPPPRGLSYKTQAVRGVDHEAIRDACAGGGVDLLVIGAEGRTAAAAALIGNVAVKIVRDTPCSVWLARAPGRTLTVKDALRRLMGI